MARLYQLVLEFTGDRLEDFDRVIGFEDLLKDALANDDVDGHDVGQGIMNIFLRTDEPQRCFEEAMRALDGVEPGLAAAGYRAVDGQSYVRVWPKDDRTEFRLR
jgi:hypothetical protein